MTYYEVLEIDSRASTEDVERAFRRLARKVHPDLNAGDAPKAEARMKQLNEIRETLTDPLLRAGYDERLRLEALRPRTAPPRPERPAERPAPRAPEPAQEDEEDEGDEAKPAPPPAPGAPGPARPPWALLTLVAVGAGAMATVIALFPHATARPIEPPEAYDVDASTAAPSGARPPGVASSPEARPTHRSRGRGVVRLGSSTDDVLRAFGPPDRLETGPGPGDAVLHYGALRLEMKNGRVAGGDAAAR
jgi:curved DNA-binding protein CbpA